MPLNNYHLIGHLLHHVENTITANVHLRIDWVRKAEHQSNPSTLYKTPNGRHPYYYNRWSMLIMNPPPKAKKRWNFMKSQRYMSRLRGRKQVTRDHLYSLPKIDSSFICACKHRHLHTWLAFDTPVGNHWPSHVSSWMIHTAQPCSSPRINKNNFHLYMNYLEVPYSVK